MSKNSLVFIIVAVFVLAAGFLMLQDDGTSEPATHAAQSNAPAQSAQPQLSEEEQALAELKKKAAVSNVQVSKLYATRCAACHGYQGEGAVGPRLIGMSEAKLTKSLQDYKQGRVPNSLMKGLLTNSTDEELAALAAEIAKF